MVEAADPLQRLSIPDLNVLRSAGQQAAVRRERDASPMILMRAVTGDEVPRDERSPLPEAIQRDGSHRIDGGDVVDVRVRRDPVRRDGTAAWLDGARYEVDDVHRRGQKLPPVG